VPQSTQQVTFGIYYNDREPDVTVCFKYSVSVKTLLLVDARFRERPKGFGGRSACKSRRSGGLESLAMFYCTGLYVNKRLTTYRLTQHMVVTRMIYLLDTISNFDGRGIKLELECSSCGNKEDGFTTHCLASQKQIGRVPRNLTIRFLLVNEAHGSTSDGIHQLQKAPRSANRLEINDVLQRSIATGGLVHHGDGSGNVLMGKTQR
jgi:hypothetical protein